MEAQEGRRRYNPRPECRGDRYQGNRASNGTIAQTRPRSRPWRTHRSVPSRASSLEPWLDRLQTEWEVGCQNGAELWRRLRAAGFPGSLRVVAEWATRRRRDDRDASPSRCPAPRALARLLSSAREKLTRNESIIVAITERAVPELVTARRIIDEFQDLIRKHHADGLAAWLERALSSPVARFAKGIEADCPAVTAAFASPWSNGQKEGTICRLKSLKRQMYGRANIDLLRVRLMPIAA
jgi:transposase